MRKLRTLLHYPHTSTPAHGFSTVPQKGLCDTASRNLREILHQSSDPKANDFMEALCQEGFLKVIKIMWALRKVPGTPVQASLRTGVFVYNRPLVTTPPLPGTLCQVRETPSTSGGEKRKEAQYEITREKHSLDSHSWTTREKPNP